MSNSGQGRSLTVNQCLSVKLSDFINYYPRFYSGERLPDPFEQIAKRLGAYVLSTFLQALTKNNS